MKKVPFEYVDCSRCAVLERKLAEAQERVTILEAAVEAFEEAQRSLEIASGATRVLSREIGVKDKRTEALLEALTVQRDHWRAALVAWEDNDTVDVAYSSAVSMESGLTRLLKEHERVRSEYESV